MFQSSPSSYGDVSYKVVVIQKESNGQLIGNLGTLQKYILLAGVIFIYKYVCIKKKTHTSQ